MADSDDDPTYIDQIGTLPDEIPTTPDEIPLQFVNQSSLSNNYIREYT
jgi:hypothetical protein